MAKDLPYFKFFCSEWSDGDISLEDMEIQGLFINICAYYWSNECNLTLTKVKKKFRQIPENNFKILIDIGVMKVNKYDELDINFLNEQLYEREEKSIKNSENGKLGGRPRKANQKQIESETKPNGLFFESELKANKNPLREEDRREEEKREDNISTNVDMSTQISIDYEKLKNYWNDTFKGSLIPQIKILSEERKKKIKSLVNQFGKEEFIKAINEINQSDFCKGLQTNWHANFDFLLQKNSFIKLLEGSYRNNNQQKPQQQENNNTTLPKSKLYEQR